MLRSLALLTTTALPTLALADAPKVATDIVPVHGLVARVMDGVGAPALVIPPAASPHGYALRPSEARALSEAQLVFWTGPELSPWLEEPIATLAANAKTQALIDLDETTVLPFREVADFAKAHDHEGHDHEDHDDHGHDDHGDEKDHDHDHDDHAEKDDHGHDDHKDHDHDHDDHAKDDHRDHDHDDHAKDDGHDHDDHSDHKDHDHEEHAEKDDHGHDHDHDHAHGDTDPHAWLSPDNAKVWMNAIAAALAAEDPDNAETYRANAAAGAAEIDAALSNFDGIELPAYLVLHDSYQYLETAWGRAPLGTMTLTDASTLPPAELAELRDEAAEAGLACVFIEPGTNANIVTSVLGDEIKLVTADPLGRDLEQGAGHYPALLGHLADAAKSCAE